MAGRTRGAKKRPDEGGIGATGIRSVAASALVALATPVHPAGAAASGPAFYTWQAPGGAATAGAKVIALTFDDGPSPYTPAVLSVLQQYHVPATFFEIGDEVARYPQYSQLLTAAGYPVENHTWSHPDLTTLPAGAVGAQIDQTQAEIRAVTGTTPQCLRPPYDAFERDRAERSRRSRDDDDELLGRPQGLDASGGQRRSCRPSSAPRSQGPWSACTTAEVTAPKRWPRCLRSSPSCGPRATGSSRSAAAAISGPQVTATYGFGDAPTPGSPITSNLPLVGAALAGTGSPASGYWEVASDGGIFSFGTAAFHGSMGGQPLNEPIVGMAATPDGNGYWEVASDGGIFSFGTAAFHGSMGGQPLNEPIVGMAATPDGNGYWEVASDGGIFSFGTAAFHGSMGGQPLNEPIVGMAATPDGDGYWEVASDGGIFSFGTAAFHGSMGGQPLNAPIVGMAPGPAGQWLLGAGRGRRRVLVRRALLRLARWPVAGGPVLRHGGDTRRRRVPAGRPAPSALGDGGRRNGGAGGRLRRGGRGEPVADAPDGGDPPRLLRVGLDLEPDPAYVLGHGRASLPAAGRAPHPFEQLLAGEHAARARGQEGQQVELLAGHRDLGRRRW